MKLKPGKNVVMNVIKEDDDFSKYMNKPEDNDEDEKQDNNEYNRKEK